MPEMAFLANLETLLTPWPTFVYLALIGGLWLALLSAPLGVFVVWQKQSYFGAALAHTALIGVSLGLWLQINITLAIVGVAVVAAWLIHALSGKTHLANDTLLGLFAHASLALALIMISLQPPTQVDIMAYLFGDLLSITAMDLGLMAGLSVWMGVFFLRHWSDMLNLTLNTDLAQVEGVPAKPVQKHYLLILAVLIALAIKMVGVLLITSLLIIPAASARRFARSPEGMLIGASTLGVLSVLLGMLGSFWWDLPSGPAIVITATVFFMFSLLKPLPGGVRP